MDSISEVPQIQLLLTICCDQGLFTMLEKKVHFGGLLIFFMNASGIGKKVRRLSHYCQS